MGDASDIEAGVDVLTREHVASASDQVFEGYTRERIQTFNNLYFTEAPTYHVQRLPYAEDIIEVMEQYDPEEFDELVYNMGVDDYRDWLSALCTHGSINQIVEHLDVIADLYDTDIAQLVARDYGYEPDIGEVVDIELTYNYLTYACLTRVMEDPKAIVPPDVLWKLYDHTLNGSRAEFSSNFIHCLLKQNEKNRSAGQGIDLEAQIRRDVASGLVEAGVDIGDMREWKTKNYPRWAERMAAIDKLLKDNGVYVEPRKLPTVHSVSANMFVLDELYLHKPEVIPEILIDGLLLARNSQEVNSVLRPLSDQILMDTVRDVLRTYLDKNPAFRPKFDAAFLYFGLDTGANVTADPIGTLYRKSDYEHLPRVTDAVSDDVEVLLPKIKPAKKVLDVACGPGRNFFKFKQALAGGDTTISGIDIMPNFVASIKKTDPEADVRQGSWEHLPYEDESFDALYCLGRSVLHNTSLPAYKRCLMEMKRVVKKQGGRIYLDTPNPDVGDIRESVLAYQKRADELGIINYTRGSINDSPDNIYFCDRLALTSLQFAAIARIAGLRVEMIAQRPYGDEIKRNTNIYWELTPLPDSDRLTQAQEELLQKVAVSNVYHQEDCALLSELVPEEYIQKYGEREDLFYPKEDYIMPESIEHISPAFKAFADQVIAFREQDHDRLDEHKAAIPIARK